MKKIFLITFSALTCFSTSFGQSVDSLRIIPSPATSTDDLKLVVITSFAGGPCSFVSAYPNVQSGDTITVQPIYCYESGSGGCTSVDTLSIGQLAAGNYQVSLQLISTNAPGSCGSQPYILMAIEQFNFTVTQGTPLLAVAVNVMGISCFGECNGSAIVSVTGGVPPYNYIWSNGAIGQTIQGLCAGMYALTITDNAGSTVTETIAIAEPPSIVISGSVTDASCGICDGEIDVTVTGGTPPYNFWWFHNNDHSQHLSGLCPGDYYALVTDANGCFISETLLVQGSAGCFDTISGTIYHDVNGDCIQDAGDDGIPNFLVDLTPGGAVYTDSNGFYSFVRDTGMYEVNAVLHDFHNVICPPSNSYTLHLDTAGLHAAGNDFALQIIPVQDLSASLFCGNARPGFLSSNSFSINNEGSVTMNGTAELYLDSRLTFVSATPAPDSSDTGNNIFYWNFSNLGMGQGFTVYFTAQVPAPPAVIIGNTLFNSVLVTLWRGMWTA